MAIFRVHGVAVRPKPGKKMMCVRLVDGTSKDASGVGGVVASRIALAMYVQHDRRGRGTPHRRRGHPVKDKEAGRSEEDAPRRGREAGERPR